MLIREGGEEGLQAPFESSVISLDLVPILFIVTIASGLHLSPVHPVFQIPLLLSLGEQRYYSLYVTEVSPLLAGGGHIAISLAFPPLEKWGSAQLIACMSIKQFCTCVISLSA